jgi:hypothetical protein
MSYPKLVIEKPSEVDGLIESAFALVNKNILAWHAKDVLYPINSDPENELFFGGGSNHIWICTKYDVNLASHVQCRYLEPGWQQNPGASMPARRAIIYFNPYLV